MKALAEYSTSAFLAGTKAIDEHSANVRRLPSWQVRRHCSANIRRIFVVLAFVPARKAFAERSSIALLASTKAFGECSSDERSPNAFLKGEPSYRT